MSNSSRTPVPSAVISAWISWFCSTLSIRAFSTLRILPRSGSTACLARSRPCFAEPPAESPSTMNSSLSSRSALVQSLNLPGRFKRPVVAVLRRLGTAASHDLLQEVRKTFLMLEDLFRSVGFVLECDAHTLVDVTDHFE